MRWREWWSLVGIAFVLVLGRAVMAAPRTWDDDDHTRAR